MVALGCTLYIVPNPSLLLLGKFFIGFGLCQTAATQSELSVYEGKRATAKHLTIVYFTGIVGSICGSILLICVFPHIDINIGSMRLWSGNLPAVTLLIFSCFTFLVMLYILRKKETSSTDALSSTYSINDENFKQKKKSDRCRQVERNRNTTTSRADFNSKKEYFTSILMLFKNKYMLILLANTMFLQTSKSLYAIYAPISLYQCYDLHENTLGVLFLIWNFASLAYLPAMRYILNYVSEVNFILVKSFGLLTLIVVQLVLTDKYLYCDCIIMNYMYIYIIVASVQRVLAAALLGKIIPKELKATGQSLYELVIVFTNILIGTAVGILSQKSRLLFGFNFAIGLISVLLMLANRSKFK